MSQSNKHAVDSLSYGDKIALAAGSLALLPMGAEAGIVYHPEGVGPINVHSPYTPWDVDSGNPNNAGDEFLMAGFHGTSASISTAAPGFARGMVQTNSQSARTFQKLAMGFAIGPSLSGHYRWGATHVVRTIISHGGTTVGSGAAPGGFTGGGNEYFGFRFTDLTGGLFYGWANLNIDLANQQFSITEWAYNDVAEAPIAVGDTGTAAVPEPGTLSLALLGMGAGGLRAWRGRKAAQASAA